MLNFIRQSRALILIATDSGMTVYRWQKKTLTRLASYSETPEVEFTFILEEHKKFPVIIVTDFFEESFRHETVSHVTGNDRRALLDRKLGYAFRNTPFRSANILHREKEGRKDDHVLFSALTRPELLTPWITMILEKDMAIQSITSIAYLMESFARQNKLDQSPFLLLVSVENETELRQTYLRNGKVYFSRLTSLTSNELSHISQAITQESMQIRQYLERIKQLPFDSQLNIKLFSSLDQSLLENHLNDDRLNNFEVFDTQELAGQLGLENNLSVTGTTEVVLTAVLQKSRVTNYYGNFDNRKYFHLKSISRCLIATSALLIIGTVSFKAGTIFESLENLHEADRLTNETQPLLAEYEERSQRFPETPIPSTEMALVVETYELIQDQSHSPIDIMTQISQALTHSPELQITEIDWNLIEQEKEQVNLNAGFSPPPSNPGAVLQNATMENRTRLKITIQGISYSPSSYTEAQDKVFLFLDALREIPDFTVEPMIMPTDIRVDTSLTTIVDDKEVSAPFSVQLLSVVSP